jgi:hypothetical protein
MRITTVRQQKSLKNYAIPRRTEMFAKIFRVPHILLIVAFFISASSALGQYDLIAIDVLIQPGGKMMGEAERWNAMMREQSPEGFELDEEHAPSRNSNTAVHRQIRSAEGMMSGVFQRTSVWLAG